MSAEAARLRIDPQLLEDFPDLRVGGFAVRELARAAEQLGSSRVQALWTAARATLVEEDMRLERVAESAAVREWREAFAKCGLKPSTYRSSVEALVRRVLKDGEVTSPLPVVTAYCAVSVRHLTPLGAYDVDRLPQVALSLRRIAPGSDEFTPLGGKAEDFPLSPRVAAYASGNTLLCWSFNHRDSRATCLQSGTRDALFIGESLSPRAGAALEAALRDLRALLVSLGAQAGELAFADAAHPEMILENST